MEENQGKLNLKIWKQDDRDNFSIIDCPSYKAVVVLETVGGKIVGDYYRATSDEKGWMIRINDSDIKTAIELLRKLRKEGMNFEE